MTTPGLARAEARHGSDYTRVKKEDATAVPGLVHAKTNHGSSNTGMKVNYALGVSGLALLAVLGFMGWFFLVHKDKIAYVDASKLLGEYKGAIDVRKEMEGKTAQIQANVDTLTYEVQQLITSYEQEAQKLSEKVRKDRQSTIAAKQQQLMQYQQAVRENMLQEDGKASQEVIGEINRFLTGYGKEKHYKLILIASNVGTIAYADEGIDLTNEVLEALNRNYLPKTP